MFLYWQRFVNPRYQLKTTYFKNILIENISYVYLLSSIILKFWTCYRPYELVEPIDNMVRILSLIFMLWYTQVKIHMYHGQQFYFVNLLSLWIRYSESNNIFFYISVREIKKGKLKFLGFGTSQDVLTRSKRWPELKIWSQGK